MTTIKYRNPHLNEVKKEFQDLKDKLSREPQLQKKIDNAFVEQLSKKGQDEGMREAIDALTTRIIQLDKKFDLIRSNLYEVDLKYGKKFEPAWKDIRQLWRDFLKKSQSSALKTQSYVDEFLDIHIKRIQEIKNEADRQEALLELKKFIAKPDPRGRIFSALEVQASEPSDVLVRLKKDLEKFRTSFNTFADEKLVVIDGKVKTLKKQIAEVVEELEEAVELLEEIEHFVHLSHEVTTGGSLILVFIHCTPLHILVMFLELVTLIGGSIAIWKYMQDVVRLQQKLSELQAELAQSEKELERLKSIKAMVDDIPDVTSISSKIDRLDDIWLAVARDTNTLRQALEAGGEKFEAIRDRIVQMRAFYDSISTGLAHYSGGYLSRLSE